MWWRERQYVDRTNIRAILAGMLPGALLGAWLLTIVSMNRLGILFGSVILFAAFISLLGIHLRLNRASGFSSGFLAGVMGASTGIGAPVLAILYQQASGPVVRATLAMLYTAASTMVVVILMFYGRFGWVDAGYAAMLVPGFVVGYLCSRPLALYFDHGATRYVVLGVSAIASLSLIVNSL